MPRRASGAGGVATATGANKSEAPGQHPVSLGRDGYKEPLASPFSQRSEVICLPGISRRAGAPARATALSDWLVCLGLPRPRAGEAAVTYHKSVLQTGTTRSREVSARIGVTSDEAENPPQLRVLYGEDSQESKPPVTRRVKTHTARTQDSSTLVPWRWRSRGARIRGSYRPRGIGSKRARKRFKAVSCPRNCWGNGRGAASLSSSKGVVPWCSTGAPIRGSDRGAWSGDRARVAFGRGSSVVCRAALATQVGSPTLTPRRFPGRSPAAITLESSRKGA